MFEKLLSLLREGYIVSSQDSERIVLVHSKNGDVLVLRDN